MKFNRLIAGGLLGLFCLPLAAQTVAVQYGSALKYRANSADPGLGISWTAENFADAGWTTGSYGAGYETATAAPWAVNLLQTAVPATTKSLYTRATFNIADVSQLTSVSIGCDYDDAYVAWINGVEVFRSPEMVAGTPDWYTDPGLHESSNGAAPVYTPLNNISAAALTALHNGANVLAIGVWNSGAGSSDLVLVPQLSYTTSGTPPLVVRGPYLQRGTPDSVIVRWRTNFATNSRVQYGPAPGSLTAQSDDAGLVTDHVVQLSGLSADALYYYSVGSQAEVLAGGDANHYFRTSPAAGRAGPARIWVLGDSGTANSNASAVRDAFYTFNGTTPVRFWMMLGDNAYATGTDPQYQAGVFDMYPATLRTSVLWPAYGNHDSYSADATSQTGPYFDIFSLPAGAQAGGVASGTEVYYSFDYGNIHFICLDSMTSSRAPGGAMMTWLQQDLAASTGKDWRIAFWHHPPYTRGSHNSDNLSGNDFELVEMRENFLPILEQAGIDLILSGHSHSYERSFLLDGHYGYSASFLESMKKDAGSGRPAGSGAYRKPTPGPAPREGAVYAVPGSSGQISGGLLNHPAMYISLNQLGSMVLDVNGGRIDAKFLNSAGVVADSFTLQKGAPAPRAVPDGRFVPGVAAKAAKLSADGSRLQMTWDIAGCRKSTQYEIVWGAGSVLSGMTPSGAACDIGTSGNATWEGVPAVPPGETFIWWTIVGTDGLNQEGPWGYNSAGAEEHPASSSGYCGMTVKNSANSCP